MKLGALPPLRRAMLFDGRSSVCTLSGRPQVCHYAIAHTARPFGHRTVTRSGKSGVLSRRVLCPCPSDLSALACIAAVPAIDTLPVWAMIASRSDESARSRPRSQYRGLPVCS